MSKKKNRKPLEFGERDICRKSIDWFIMQASLLYNQLEKENERGLLAGTTPDEDTVFIMFKGNAQDIFKFKAWLEREDAQNP
jgi:hypothetical protein